MSEIVHPDDLGDWDDSSVPEDPPVEIFKPTPKGVLCVRCGIEVNPNKTGTYREVRGWERVRQGGGANAIVMRKETGALMCGTCGEDAKSKAKRGIDPEQQPMW